MKIDFKKIPPSADDIQAERNDLIAKIAKNNKKQGWLMLGLLFAFGVISYVIYSGFNFEEVLFIDLTIGQAIAINILGIFIFVIYLINQIEKLCKEDKEKISELNELNPLDFLEEFKKIEKVASKLPVVKQYIQSALSQRGFLIRAEYQALSAWEDDHESLLQIKEAQDIYVRLKGETI